MNPVSPMAPSPAQLPQLGAPAPQAPAAAPAAASAPMFGAGFGDQFNFNPERVAEKLFEKLEANPQTAAALEVVKRVLAGDATVVDEQLQKLMKPVDGVVDQVRQVAGDQVADHLKEQVDGVVNQAKSQAQVVQTLPLIIEPVLEKLKSVVDEQGQKLFGEEVIEQLKQSFEQQKQQMELQEEMLEQASEQLPQLPAKVNQLLDAVAGKLGIGGGSALDQLFGALGGLFGAMATEEEAAPKLPELTAEQKAELDELLRSFEQGSNGDDKQA